MQLAAFRTPRLWVLGALLLLVIAASAVSREPERAPSVVAATEPTARYSASRGEAAPRASLDLERLKRAKLPDPRRNLFAPRSVSPPPAPVPVVAEAPPPAPPAPVPMAPPLPFTYMGKLIDDPAHPVFFLVKAGQLHAVSQGELIDGTYRVDGVSHGQLRLHDLPLDTPQFLAIGEGS